MKLVVLVIAMTALFIGGGVTMESMGVESNAAYAAYGYFLGVVYCCIAFILMGDS